MKSRLLSFRLLAVLAGLTLSAACASDAPTQGYSIQGISSPAPAPPVLSLDSPKTLQPLEASSAPEPTVRPTYPAPATAPQILNDDSSKVGQVIFACERHLVTWTAARAGDSEHKAETIGFTESAFSLLAKREQAILEQEAVSGPPRNRGIATAALGFTHDPGVLHLILNNIGNSDPEVCSNALLGLAVLGDPNTPIGPIREILNQDKVQPAIRLNAAWALQQIALKTRADEGGELSATLAPLLTDPLPHVRATAASAMGLIRASHLVPALSNLLLADTDPLVRTAAAYSLGEIQALGSTEVLARALSDHDPVVAGAAHGALVKLYAKDYGSDPAPWLQAMVRAAR